MSDLFNPRAVVGDNASPDFAREITERMAAEYALQMAATDQLLAEANELPPEVEDDATLGLYATVIKRFRDHVGRLNAYHEAEKAEYLRKGQAIDQFFFGMIDRLRKRSRAARPGAQDVLQARVDDYTARKVAAERAKRAREAAEREAAERKAREEAEAAQRAAEAARQAAERARKNTEVKVEVARAAEAQADARGVDVVMAQDKAADAVLATKAKSSDIARTRLEGGALATAAQTPYAEILDDDALDKRILWPFIKLEEKERALRAWAKSTGHKVEMEGAAIGFRDRGQIR